MRPLISKLALISLCLFCDRVALAALVKSGALSCGKYYNNHNECRIYKDSSLFLPVSTLKAGIAVLTGHIKGYRPEMRSKAQVLVSDPVTNDQKQIPFDIDSLGEFRINVPMICDAQVTLADLPRKNKIVILLSPGNETSVYLNQDTGNERERLHFTGAYADINNQIIENDLTTYTDRVLNLSDYYKGIEEGVKPDSLESLLLTKVRNGIDGLSKMKGLLKKTRQLVETEIRLRAATTLLNTWLDYNNAVMVKRGLDRPSFNREFFAALKELKINDNSALYYGGYSNLVNSIRYIPGRVYDRPVRVNYLKPYLIDELLLKRKWSEKEIKYLRYMKVKSPEYWDVNKIREVKQRGLLIASKWEKVDSLLPSYRIMIQRLKHMSLNQQNNVIAIQEQIVSLFDLAAKDHIKAAESVEVGVIQLGVSYPDEEKLFGKEFISDFYQKYGGLVSSCYRKDELREVTNCLADILNEDKGILFDLLATQTFSSKIVHQKSPLNAFDLDQIRALGNSFYFEYLDRLNNQVNADLEREKKTGGYMAYSMPESDKDSVLFNILRPFKGKVVHIDFWATWCVPCIMAMKDFKEVKGSYSGKDVVFVYLTDESSTEEIWNDMMIQIKGEHFRISREQMSYLQSKFGLQGLPSYLILDRTGKPVYSHSGFEGNNIIKEIIDKEL